MTTKPDTSGLTRAQETALGALIRGTSITDAAQESGVARQTVSHWKNNDPEFIAALNRGRRDAWEQEQDRLRAVRAKALDVIAAELDNNGSFGRAMEVLKALSRMSLKPEGKTSAEQVASDQAMDRLMSFL